VNKRITLSYTVELDNLEEEVVRLYDNVSGEMSTIIGQLQKPDKLLTIEAYECIDTIRQSLTSFDVQLQDINLIINSYISYQAEINKLNHSTAPVKENEDTT
jgi:hypothetical protein